MMPRSGPWSDVYVGTPFVARGRTRAGWDCYGAVFVIYAEQLGIALPRWEIDTFDVRTVAAAVRGEAAGDDWMAVTSGEKPFDVAVMRALHRSGYAAEFHVGLVVRPKSAGDGLLLHCEQPGGTVCLPFGHPDIAGRIRSFHRHRKVCGGEP